MLNRQGWKGGNYCFLGTAIVRVIAGGSWNLVRKVLQQGQCDILCRAGLGSGRGADLCLTAEQGRARLAEFGAAALWPPRLYTASRAGASERYGCKVQEGMSSRKPMRVY